MPRANQNDVLENLDGKSKGECVHSQNRVKERKRARVERGAVDEPRVLENRDDEQMTVGQTDASGGDIRENQHEEDRMRERHPRLQKRIRGSR